MGKEVVFIKDKCQSEKEIHIDTIYKVYEVSDDLTKKEYLQQSKNESDDDFNIKTKFSVVGMHFRNGIDAMLNIVFNKPTSIESILSDKKIDTESWEYEIVNRIEGNSSITDFSKEVLKKYLLEGEVYGFTYSTGAPVAGETEARQKNIRGETVIFDRNRIVDTYTLFKNNNPKNEIIQACYSTYYLSTDKKTNKKSFETQYNVASLEDDGTTTIKEYRDDDGKGYIEVDEKTGISVFPITRLGNSDISNPPPLYDTAKAQINWMTQRAEMRSFANRLGFPIVVVHGMKELVQNIKAMIKQNPSSFPCKEYEDNCIKSKMLTGGVGFSVGQLKDGKQQFKVEIIELNGDNYQVMVSESKLWEDYIVNSFSQISVSSKGNKSAEESKNEVLSDISTLSAKAIEVEHFVNEVHRKNCVITGVENELKVSLSKDFLVHGVDHEMLKLVISLGGTILSQKGIINNIQKINPALSLSEEDIIKDYSEFTDD